MYVLYPSQEKKDIAKMISNFFWNLVTVTINVKEVGNRSCGLISVLYQRLDHSKISQIENDRIKEA